MSSSPIIYPTSSSSVGNDNYTEMDNSSMYPEDYLASSMDIPPSIGSTSAYRAGQTPPRTGTTDCLPSSDFGGEYLSSYSQNRRENLSDVVRSHRHDLGVSSFNPAFFHDASSSQNRTSTQNFNATNYSNTDIQVSEHENITEGRQPETLLIVWGTNIIVKDVVATFRTFLENFTLAHLPDEHLALNSNRIDDQYSPFYPKLLSFMHSTESRFLNLDGLNLRSYIPSRNLFGQLLTHPQEMIPIMDMTVNEYYLELFPGAEDIINNPIQVRPFNMDKHVNLRELSPSEVDQLVTIKGLVIRASPIMPDMRSGFFKCTSCEHTITVDNVKGKIAEPSKCQRSECGVANSMVLIHNRCLFSDKQIVKVQETPDSVPDGQTPHAVTVCLYDSLIDMTRPGDRVEITGIFRVSQIRANTHQRRIKSIFRTYVDVVHLKKTDPNRIDISAPDTVSEEDFATQGRWTELDSLRTDNDTTFAAQASLIASSSNLYERLANSIAPSIWRMETVKKCLLLQLFGGVSKSIKAGAARFRGDINVLIAGDPSVSKSQLLQYVHKLAPRGIYTSGKGSSAVGLTAYVTRDTESGQYVLESGALVLSDGGICCIDEFDKMTDNTRSVLHEVMEQQTISVAKAGIITTLNARTSVLAAANPIDSKYNSEKSIIENLNLPPSLLSRYIIGLNDRFDLICLVLDRPDEANDIQLARHIASLHVSPDPNEKSEDFNSELQPLNIQTMARYISYARKYIHPVLSDEAIKSLVDGYIAMRKVNSPSGASSNFSHHSNSSTAPKTVSATIRQLESLIRLSEAHARMRYQSILVIIFNRLSQSVDRCDVEEAIRLIKNAILSYALDPITGKIDMDLVNTGQSTSLRERAASLKKQVQLIFGTGMNAKSGIDLASLHRIISEQSSIYVHERLMREVIRGLLEEEWLMIATGSGSHQNQHGTLLKSSTVLKRFE